MSEWKKTIFFVTNKNKIHERKEKKKTVHSPASNIILPTRQLFYNRENL
jgi:hypothetical protein